MADPVEVALGISLGFGWCQFFSNPSHSFKLDHKFPTIASKLRFVKRRVYNFFSPNFKTTHRFEIFPSLRIELLGRKIWIHHWIWLSVVLGILVYQTQSFGQLLFFKSLCAAGALHGILYKDRFQIFVKSKI